MRFDRSKYEGHQQGLDNPKLVPRNNPDAGTAMLRLFRTQIKKPGNMPGLLKEKITLKKRN
jgi:hypothetical protein